MKCNWITLISLLLASVVPGFSQKLEKLPPRVNSTIFDEFAPVVHGNGELLFFTRVGSHIFERTLIYDQQDLNKVLSKEEYLKSLASFYTKLAGDTINDPVTSDFNQDIWAAELLDDVVGDVFHPGFPLNNALPNSAEAFIQNPDRLILINQFPVEGGIEEGISAVRIENKRLYTLAEAIDIRHFYNLSTEMSLSMTPDAQLLVFAIEKADSRGGLDLYMSARRADGSWGPPSNLLEINSEARETTPFITADKQRLYFASNRGKGDDLDIYVSKRAGRSFFDWEAPVRMARPVNSEANDFQPYVDPNDGYLYFSSTRDGSSDIFRYRFRKPMIAPNNKIPVEGRIVVNQTGEIIPGEIYYHPPGRKRRTGFFRSATGYFRVNPAFEEPYIFYANINGYRSDTVRLPAQWWEMDVQTAIDIHVSVQNDGITFKGKAPLDETVSNDIKEGLATDAPDVTPVAEDKEAGRKKTNEEVRTIRRNRPELKELQVKNVLFARTTARFLPESMGDLNRLLRTMRTYPKLRILVAGHTDNNGTKQQLYELSIRRANAVKQYLVDRGIDEDRVSITGFGGERPILSNATEYSRRLNRRVEVSIMDK